MRIISLLLTSKALKIKASNTYVFNLVRSLKGNISWLIVWDWWVSCILFRKCNLQGSMQHHHNQHFLWLSLKESVELWTLPRQWTIAGPHLFGPFLCQILQLNQAKHLDQKKNKQNTQKKSHWHLKSNLHIERDRKRDEKLTSDMTEKK